MSKNDDQRERAYMDGHAAAWRYMLGECLHRLKIATPEAQAAAWLEERLDTIALLRRVCAERGDNDWPDDLYIPDIIEKHLIDYLD